MTFAPLQPDHLSFHVAVEASTTDLYTGAEKVTNTFHYTFAKSEPLQRYVLPRSYKEAMGKFLLLVLRQVSTALISELSLARCAAPKRAGDCVAEGLRLLISRVAFGNGQEARANTYIACGSRGEGSRLRPSPEAKTPRVEQDRSRTPNCDNRVCRD